MLMNTIAFWGIVYLVSIMTNVFLTYVLKTFDVNLSGKFTIVYWILSPFTLFGTIYESLKIWYSALRDKNELIKTLRDELGDTKYGGIDDETLLDISLLIGEHLEYIQYPDMETIFDDMLDKGYIYRDENGNYHINKNEN